MIPARAGVSRPVSRYSFHGVPVELKDDFGALAAEVQQILGRFALAGDAPPTPITGTIRGYSQAEVVRTLSSNAVRVATPNLALGEASDVCMELYQEGERFWLVDDRWGMAEINLLKGSWRSWVLPTATLDPARCVELAVLWPLAQLLRSRGLYLLPGASVARGDWAFLILSPLGLDGELTALVRNGFGVIGQRWTCVRETEAGGPLEMLHVPGHVERSIGPRLLPAAGEPTTVDLTAEYCGSHRDRAECDAVLIVEPGRRPAAHVKELPGQLALDGLRRNWPIVELHRQKRQLPMKLATRCRVYGVQLSRRPEDLMVLLTSIMSPTGGATSDTPLAKGAVRVRAAVERRFVASMVKAAS